MSQLTRRRRIGLKGELMLALMPTVTVLGVLALLEAVSKQRLLFASLASSAFLIYLDPEHAVNQVRTLVLSQCGSALLGLLCYLTLGPGYLSGGLAMVLAIGAMVVLDAMHPPAVSTALSFGLRAGDESNLVLFSMAVGVTALLVVLQRTALWTLRRVMRPRRDPAQPQPGSTGEPNDGNHRGHGDRRQARCFERGGLERGGLERGGLGRGELGARR